MLGMVKGGLVFDLGRGKGLGEADDVRNDCSHSLDTENLGGVVLNRFTPMGSFKRGIKPTDVRTRGHLVRSHLVLIHTGL